ncbi:MAG: 50S ribosomal protein L24 [Sphaerobacteraceae bacterium]|nr:MAG: 50S ribosomal protein L24 [Sphaerobacteraceae bacterium]
MSEKIVTGDQVLVIRGKDRGARATIRQNMPSQDRVIAEGVNVAKKHQRAIPRVRQAGIIDMEMPMHVSKVMLVCPSCDQPTRVGFRADGDKKVRYCKKCDAVIGRPSA